MADQAKTKQEVIERLLSMFEGADKELAHDEADHLLLDALLIAGMDDVVTAWQECRERVGFWYA